ncbi:MAG: insulinase family protein [Acidobacteria bacterium]|nr:insulinase family protein [Acidobacteriota bacterium]
MDVQKREMQNGLVAVTEVMPYLHSAAIGVWVKSGSRCENEADAGVSHFIEHLLFKGTTTKSALAIAKAIDSVGGQLNAFTEKEYVCLHAKVLDRHLPFALGILADIALNPTFPADEMEREREVIFEEISMIEDSPQDLIQDLYMENLWKGHPLGRPISGTRESVERITRAKVKQYFRDNYTAHNTIISIAGNIQHASARRLVERYFGELEPGVPVDPGPPPECRASNLVRAKPNLEQTHLCLGTGCPPVTSEKRYALHLLCNILGGGVSSRLFQSIREKRGLAYSIYSSLNLYRDVGTLSVYAGAAPDKVMPVIELVIKELKKMCRQPVPAHELRRAKDNLLGSVMLSLESSSSRMTQLAQQQIYFDRFYTPEEIIREFESVEAEDIQGLCQDVFDSAPLSLTLLGSQDGREVESMNLEV